MEYLSELRKTAVGAADMRLELSLDYGKEVEYMPLSKVEIATVREVFSAFENTPLLDFNMWLKERHDSSFGPQPADLLQHWNALPFRAAAKKRMHELLTAREQERAKALNLPGVDASL